MTFQGDNMMAVKRNNRSAALRILHEKGEMSRKKLAEYMQLTPAAITKIVAEMLGEGLLHEGDAVTSGSVGRREIPVALNVRCVCALGMLINTRQAILSAVWLDGSVIFSEEIPLPPRASADETVEMLTRRLLALAAEAGLERGSILGVGLAVRGVTSPDGRTVADSFGALREANYPICERVEALCGLPITDKESALRAADALLATGLQRVFLSLGPHGVLAVEGIERLFLPNPPLRKRENASGCGDAFMAALAWAFLQGADLRRSALCGLTAAAVTMERAETVNPGMSAGLIQSRMELI